MKTAINITNAAAWQIENLVREVYHDARIDLEDKIGRDEMNFNPRFAAIDAMQKAVQKFYGVICGLARGGNYVEANAELNALKAELAAIVEKEVAA